MTVMTNSNRVKGVAGECIQVVSNKHNDFYSAGHRLYTHDKDMDQSGGLNQFKTSEKGTLISEYSTL